MDKIKTRMAVIFSLHIFKESSCAPTGINSCHFKGL